jgi:hypothetical protein
VTTPAPASEPAEAGTAPSSERCPACGALVPATPGFVTWCECGWNVTPPEPAPGESLPARLHAQLSARLGHRLFEAVRAQPGVRPRNGMAEVLLVLASVAVVLATPALLAGAIAWSILSPNLVAFAAAVILGLAAAIALPRPRRLPWHLEAPASRCSQLHRLVADVARHGGAPRPHRMVLVPEYNAFATRVGVRRRRVVGLGLPLLFGLEARHWGALIGHELGHVCNGDVSRPFWTEAAMRSLATWHAALEPDTITEHEEGLLSTLSRLGLPSRSCPPPCCARSPGCRGRTPSGRSTSPTGRPPPPREVRPWSSCWSGSSPEAFSGTPPTASFTGAPPPTCSTRSPASRARSRRGRPSTGGAPPR